MARRKKVTTKECTMPGRTLPTTAFNVNKNSTDVYHSYSTKSDNIIRRFQATGATVGTTELSTILNNLIKPDE